MITLSNKPNVRALKNVVEDIKYRTQLIGREQRLFSGLIATRISGMAIGFILAMVLVGLPILYTIMVGV
ncbi:MAG: tetrahydromethanopterin S-methyltransferase subunit F [Methanobacteriaceae archaeon]